jgi:REP element-mobilizing transposase RayT
MSQVRGKNKGREFEPRMPEPLAYFLTWTTYGTWLPGDERGWVRYRRGIQAPDSILKREAAARMTDDACRLDNEQRELVETTIQDHCRIRGWTLFAVNCRSNHVHVVVASKREPKEIREQFKAWCTRLLKAEDQQRRSSALEKSTCHQTAREKWWAERGSGICINDEECLEAVIHYVNDAQDHRREH